VEPIRPSQAQPLRSSDVTSPTGQDNSQRRLVQKLERSSLADVPEEPVQMSYGSSDSVLSRMQYQRVDIASLRERLGHSASVPSIMKKVPSGPNWSSSKPGESAVVPCATGEACGMRQGSMTVPVNISRPAAAGIFATQVCYRSPSPVLSRPESLRIPPRISGNAHHARTVSPRAVRTLVGQSPPRSPVQQAHSPTRRYVAGPTRQGRSPMSLRTSRMATSEPALRSP